MKTKITFFICGLLFLGTLTLKAQNPITTLQHAGTTQVFYGNNSFTDAVTAASKGDTLYLSAGTFNAATINKGLYIVGAGHFPDSSNAVRLRRTTISGGININIGADSLHLEGLYVTGDINFQADASINYVTIFRCNFISANFNSKSSAASKNHCTLDECFVRNLIDFGSSGDFLLIKHCVIYYIQNTNKATIEGNIFLYFAGLNYNNPLATVRNNIFSDYVFIGNTTENLINNNILKSAGATGIDGQNNSWTNNYGVGAPSSIFVKLNSANVNDYSNNYHLLNPTTYLGTDGTQVGIYGGVTPFKDGASPTNPQVLKKSIDNQTDSNGKLQIDFTVKAQNN